MFSAYIIKSLNKRWYYVGSTDDIERRLREHNNGLVRSTKHYMPFKLVFRKDFEIEMDARNYERKLKDKRIEKENIIRKIENK